MTAAAGSRFDFDEVADSYDQWYDTRTGIRYDRIEKQAVREFLPPSSEGNRLLEVGVGTGHWTRFFAGEGFRVFGLDCSPAMVNVARGKGIEGSSVLVADAAEIPFAPRSFDVVAAITVLEFAVDPDRVVREMARCTRPGGLLLVGALNRDSLLGLHRRLRPSAIFAGAEMLTVRSLKQKLVSYGKSEVRTVAFPRPAFASRLTGWIGRKARLPWGDFIVAVCRVDR